MRPGWISLICGEAIYAGLECEYWRHKKPDADILSLGPDLSQVHTTKERTSKESIAQTWDYLKALLKVGLTEKFFQDILIDRRAAANHILYGFQPFFGPVRRERYI